MYPMRFVLLALGGFSLSCACRAEIVEWPSETGTCASSSTLQQCIDAVPGRYVSNPVEIEIGPPLESSARYHRINEQIRINKPLALRARSGTEVVFSDGRGIEVDLQGSGYSNGTTPSVWIENIQFVRGAVQITDGGSTGTAPQYYRFNKLHFLGAKEGVMCSITANRPAAPATNAGSRFEITNNTVDLQNDSQATGGICIFGQGTSEAPSAPSDGIEIRGNRIVRRAEGLVGTGANSGIRIDMGPTRALDMASPTEGRQHLWGNTVRGPFLRPIYLACDQYGNNLAAEVISNIITGQNASSFVSSWGAISLYNARCTINLRVLNNTLYNNSQPGIYLDTQTTVPSGQTTATISNNLVALNTYGVVVSGAASVTNSKNLFFQSGMHINFTANGNSITTDPLFDSTLPSLQRSDVIGGPVSPAIDAGDDTAISGYYAKDATGEKRIVGAHVDIGAVEKTGDIAQIILASGLNTQNNEVQIDNAVTPEILRSSEYIVATPVLEQDAPLYDAVAQNLGIYRNNSGLYWAIFNQGPSSANVTLGQRYSVFIPNATFDNPVANESKYGYRHTNTFSSGATSYSWSMLNDTTRLNSSTANMVFNPEAIVVATARYENPVAPHNYHNHRIGVEFGREPGFVMGSFIYRWYVVNQDDSPMTTSANDVKSFNIVIAAPGSDNAFKAPYSLLDREEIALDHPLLNNNPCAAVTVGRNNTSPIALAMPPNFNVADVPFALQYRTPDIYGALGRWYIVPALQPVFGAPPPVLPGGSAFNVIFDGTQAARCLSQARPEDVFGNGFE